MDQPLDPLPFEVPIPAMDRCVDESMIDANGHMNAGNYLLELHRAFKPLFRYLGFGDGYRQRGVTVFQREAHLSYEKELRLGDRMLVQSWLVSHDHKRFHHFHVMRKGGGAGGPIAATAEFLTVNVDFVARRSAPFPDDVAARLDLLAAAFVKIPLPEGEGHRIQLPAT
jgi:acyl-CoA thioester hydrolase